VLPNAQKGNAEIIEKVVALLRETVPEEKIAETERFVRQYYRRVEADDLAERNLPDRNGGRGQGVLDLAHRPAFHFSRLPRLRPGPRRWRRRFACRAGLRPWISRETRQTKISKSFATVTLEAKSLARAPDLLILTKANSRSTVHRQGYLDYIGVKRLDTKGQVLGEQRFLGLFTSTAYASHPTCIPLLRRKVDNVIARAGLDSDGHMGKALVAILEQHPRDELFQASEDELLNRR
jgi:hypothetical protein